MKQVKCKVVILPTKKASNLYIYDDRVTKSLHQRELGITSNDGYRNGQHLYITSDEEIKEGDWYIYNEELLAQFKKEYNQSAVLVKKNKKIIATTDPKLNLPKPTEGFIKKFVEKYNKGEVITDIFVECTHPSFDEWESRGEPVGYYPLKLSSQNEITIHPIKQSWTRDEVCSILQEVYNLGRNDHAISQLKGEYINNLKQYLETNL